MLAADNFPAHRTIREFRALRLNEFTELFTQVVRLAWEMGLVKLGTIAVDGTKVKANASRHKVINYGRIHATEIELLAQIAALLKNATSTDDPERNEPELDIPAEMERRQARLAAVEVAKDRLEERQRQADKLAEKPFLRSIVMRLPRALWPVPKAYGHVMAFTEDGYIASDLQDPSGAYPETTGVTETADRLYVQSLHAHSLGWMAAPR